MNTDELKKTLNELGLAPSEVETFASMLTGSLKVREIMQQTGMKRPSVYYALSKLEARGLIGRVQVGEYNRWKVTDPNRLLSLVSEREYALTEIKEDTISLVKMLEKQDVDREGAKVTYFEGQKAIESVVFNSLYCKSKQILSIAPHGNFFQQTGIDFATKYVAERKRRGITSRHLWEWPIDKNIVQTYYNNVAEIRYVPKSMSGKFKTTMFIYDDTVMFIAPQESNNAVVFHSKEFANMQRAVFETIWGVSAAKPKN